MNLCRARNASLILLAAIAAASPVLADEGPFGPIHVAANRSQYSGRGCPIEIVYSATINFAPRHRGFVFNYHWERSDGARGPEKVVHTAPGQRSMVVRERWRLGAPGSHVDASAALFVNSGNTHLSRASPVVRVNCR